MLWGFRGGGLAGSFGRLDTRGLTRIPPVPNPAELQARLTATLSRNLRSGVPLKVPKPPMVQRWEQIASTAKQAMKDWEALRKKLDIRG